MLLPVVDQVLGLDGTGRGDRHPEHARRRPSAGFDLGDRQQNLARQVQLLHEGRLLLHEGRLLRAPDLTYERLTDLDFRIAQLTKRRDQAQQVLDAHLRQAESLLGATVPG